MTTRSFLSTRRRAVLPVLALAGLLAACTRHGEAPTPPPKPVKTETVGSAGSPGTGASFVGTLRARQRADLGFESAGRVLAIAVEVGDRVRAGQVLARLDEGPARWRLARAEADRHAAAALSAERLAQLQQQESLARDKIISPAALESTRSAHEQARSQLDAAEAAWAAARRDLALTRIEAPFAGEVVGRLAQPFSDVAPGQIVLQLQAGRALEVVAMLPDSVAAVLSEGDTARGLVGAEAFPIVLDRVSSRTDNGSLVQVTFRVPQAPASARSGAVVSVELPSSRPAGRLAVPATAVMPGTQAGQASVFVLEQGQLKRRPVQTDAGLQPDGRVVVTRGLVSGEQVVIAGTAFLHEGQAATVHKPQTALVAQPQGAAR